MLTSCWQIDYSPVLGTGLFCRNFFEQQVSLVATCIFSRELNRDAKEGETFYFSFNTQHVYMGRQLVVG